MAKQFGLYAPDGSVYVTITDGIGNVLAGLAGSSTYDPSARTISGSGVDVDSIIAFTVNGNLYPETTVADSNGNWTYTFAENTVPVGASIGVIINAPSTPTPSSLQNLTLSNASFAADASTSTPFGNVLGLTSGSTLTITPSDTRVTLGSRTGTTQPILVGTGNVEGTFQITLVETLSSSVNSPKSSTITIIVTAASVSRTKLTQGQSITIDNQPFVAQIPDTIVSQTAFPGIGRTNIIGGIWRNGGTYWHEVASGEMCTIAGDGNIPRKMRAEILSTRRFEKNEVIDYTFDFTIDPSSVFAGTGLAEGGFGTPVQIHQADSRYGLSDTGEVAGSYVTSTPMFAINSSWNPTTGQLDFNVTGETGLTLPLHTNPYPFPTRIHATKTNITFGVKHRIRLVVEDGHGGTGRIAVWYTDDVAGGGSAVQLCDVTTNTGYAYVDLQANKPWAGPQFPQAQTQLTSSYIKCGYYGGLSSGNNPPPFNVAIKFKDEGHKIRYFKALPPGGTAGQSYSYTPVFEGNTGTVTYSASGLSGSGLSIDSSTGVLSGSTPVAGTYSVVFTATADGIATTTLPRTIVIDTAAVSAPNAATGLTVTARAANSIDLSWTAPASGDPVNTYLVEYRTPSGSGSYTSFGTTASTTATVTGLTGGGTSYGFRVTSQNAGGSSAPTSEVVSTTTGIASLLTSKTAADVTNPQTAGLHPNPPTVTSLGNSSGATYTTLWPSNVTSVANWQAAFLMVGGEGKLISNRYFNQAYSNASGADWSTLTNLSSGYFQVVFDLADDSFEIDLLDSSVPQRWRLIVDGKYTSWTGYATAGAGGFFENFRVDFADTTTKRIQVELNGIGMPLVRIKTKTAGVITKPTLTNPIIMVQGDSISAGVFNNPNTGVQRASTSLPGFQGDTTICRAIQRMGARYISSSLGGTGYRSGSAGATWFKDRQRDFSGLTWDAAIILGGMNDSITLNGGGSRANFQTEVNAHILWLATNFPTKPIAVGGSFYNSSFIGAGATPTGVNPQMDVDIAAAVAAAKAAVPAARIGFFPVNNILNGSGSIAAPAGDGNADLYLNSDKTHPNYAGEIYESGIIAQRAYDCLMSL